MYESHFGFKGPPFQLNPDPAFYFESRGHGSALAYLKYGAHQGEGFIVVTGEIGAGKTTLVKTLLESLDSARLVAAQVVSTQLEAGDLLRTILTAFGIASSGATKAHLISTLEGFLTALAAKGRRALLIVDEAQNLDRGAVEELRMLSNFQLGNQALLQSFLVGQPELRVLLQSKSMEQLRQRVIASCHLGPLDTMETRAYIEHRLRHVGWIANPTFDDDAHEQIHRWTGGIPRRINRLCNRLLLGAFLADQASISSESVERTALDLGVEIGESLVQPTPIAGPVQSGESQPAWTHAAPKEAPVEVRSRLPSKPVDPLLCLVDTVADYLKAGALSQVFASQPALPPVVAVHMGGSADMALGVDAFGVLSLPALDVHLNVDDHGNAAGVALILTRFDAVLDEYAPAAVLAMGSGNAVLACSVLAQKKGIAVLRSNGGRRRAWATASEETNASLMDQFADVLYTENLATHYSLHRVGVAPDRVQCVGDLAANVVHIAHAIPPSRAAVDARQELAGGRLNADLGFALVTKQFPPLRTAAAQVFEAVAMLKVARAEVPLLWAVESGTLLELKASGAEVQLKTAGIAVAEDLGYLDCIALLGQARCMIAGPEARFVDEAKVLGVPSLVIDPGWVVSVKVSETASSGVAAGTNQLRKVVRDAISGGEDRVEVPDYWDGGAALRIAAHLGGWLRKQNRSRARLQRVLMPDAKP